MPYIDLSQIELMSPVAGFNGRVVHSENMSFVHWYIDKDSVLPEHQHPHEQISAVIAGEIEFVLNGEKKVLKAGDAVAVIPANVPHSARALTACVLIDVFQPVREDFK